MVVGSGGGTVVGSGSWHRLYALRKLGSGQAACAQRKCLHAHASTRAHDLGSTALASAPVPTPPRNAAPHPPPPPAAPQALQANNVLQKLNIASNRITDVGAKSLADALQVRWCGGGGAALAARPHLAVLSCPCRAVPSRHVTRRSQAQLHGQLADVPCVWRAGYGNISSPARLVVGMQHARCVATPRRAPRPVALLPLPAKRRRPPPNHSSQQTAAGFRAHVLSACPAGSCAHTRGTSSPHPSHTRPPRFGRSVRQANTGLHVIDTSGCPMDKSWRKLLNNIMKGQGGAGLGPA